jgi:hypothetical protein
MKQSKLKMRLIAPFVVICCLAGIYSPVAQAQIYLSDPTIGNFTGPITSYATFSNYSGIDGGCGSGSPPTFTPTAAELAATGCRVYNGTLTGTGLATTVNGQTNNWIEATFNSPVSTIIVFPNIDHLGAAYDGYQYSIAGSNDGTNWTMLFDATSVNGDGEPFTLGTFTGTQPLFVNNVLTPQTSGLPSSCSGTDTPCAVGYIAFFDFGTAYKYYAFGVSTVAAGNNPQPNTDQELSAVGTGPAAVTLPLKGNGVTNSFQFAFPTSPTFATYSVTYPADVSIAANTTMTISPNVLAPSDCNSAINIPKFSGGEPICTTFSNTIPVNDSVIFDVACSVNGAPSTSQQCPKTTGFDPFAVPSPQPHSSEDITNILVYASTDGLTNKAPQMLTAPEGSNAWVAYGVGFTDCVSCTRGSGGSDYNSTVVAADFPSPPNAPSPFAIPPYQFAGFIPPVANQAPGVINSAKAGSTIPFKWQLMYPVNPALGFNGGPVTNLNFPPNGYLSIFTNPITTTGCGVGAVDNTIIDTQSNTGLLNQGNGNYQFNWRTPKSLSGECLTITVSTGDGVQHNADIQFK